MRQKLLLIEDVDCLGRSGEVVSVRVGYARNFLLPKSQAVAVDKQTLKMQDRLQRERLSGLLPIRKIRKPWLLLSKV